MRFLSNLSRATFFSVILLGTSLATVQASDYFNEELQCAWGQQLDSYQDANYLYRIHKDAYYHIVAYSDNGDVVQLHDASKWEVHPSQCEQVLYWLKHDDIFIKPKSSCYSSYRYVLHNLKGQAVEVNLIKPPLPTGENTFRIMSIDYYARLVILSDNTAWQIDPNDRSFPYWKIGQRLLVGVNNNWKTARMPHILINVDMRNEPYSQADFYGYPLG